MVKQIIHDYSGASGQSVNLSKSSISFSRNTPRTVCSTISAILHINVVESHDKYLGLPTNIPLSKKQMFNQIKNRIQHKVAGWKEQLLSTGGKEVLLKAVATAIPVYAMTCFRIPRSVCQSINSIMANFWWGQKQDERKIH
ncbi:hypothetical protein P3X46_026413 [Hevea brasiliensis]|uniref:Reverse transcriptase zinc-binding domain-containing protein n=1 Tax=Hevea brasiliensis TaxID=3981 RepID=A0ABQ9KZN0_HEVBR|nr:hypothetical protein P3X46_026413 [Hevea brasiliensis]